MTESHFSIPKFTYQNIRYSVDAPMFNRAVDLFKRKKVKNLVELKGGYGATVIGSEEYRVSVSSKNITTAYCDCYMGQNDELCKHVLALGLEVLHRNGIIDDKALQTNRTDISTPKELETEIKKGLRYIKYYNGPSSTWFEYQTKLDVGAGILIDAINQAPKTVESAKVLWNMVLRVSDKLSQGVDDSNGTVWPTCVVAVEKLISWKEDESIRPHLVKFAKDETGFEFEEPLKKIDQT